MFGKEIKIEPVIESQPETLRGGCLDEFVKKVSLGYLGVETTATIGLKDEYSGKIFKGDPISLTFQIGQIYVADAGKTVHDVSRRIVKNKKA